MKRKCPKLRCKRILCILCILLFYNPNTKFTNGNESKTCFFNNEHKTQWCYKEVCYHINLMQFMFVFFFYLSSFLLFLFYSTTHVRTSFVLREYYDSSWFAKKCCLLAENNAVSREWRKGNHFDRSYQYRNDLLAPYNFARRPSPRSQERAQTCVRICPGVSHEQCHPHPDHVAQEISTDRRKPEHGLVLKQLEWEYTFVPGR